MIGAQGLAALVLASCSATEHRYVNLKAEIQNNASRFGIPAAWIATVASAETGGRACYNGRPIQSHAGAVGIMQMMRPTWNELNRSLALGPTIEDPAANLAAGAAYLRQMYDRFGYPGMFAAYNAGPGRYEQSLHGRSLPAETRLYLKTIVARLGLGEDALAPLPEHGFVSAIFVAAPGAPVVGGRPRNSPRATASPLFFYQQ